MDGGLKARFHFRFPWPGPMDRAFSPRTVSMSQFLGLYPRLGLCAPLVLGRVQPPGLSKGHRSGWFEGQRPGTIPAYGIAIGFGHRNGWRAEGPVSFPVSLARTDGSGLQPSNRFDVPNLGLYPRLGLCAPLVLGKGRTANRRRWTRMGQAVAVGG